MQSLEGRECLLRLIHLISHYMQVQEHGIQLHLKVWRQSLDAPLHLLESSQNKH
jgi:hypothetical protein